ncbi:MAG: hypothetical protein ABH834_07930 [Candidatus Altiarchaeota archaeon]
MTARHQLKRIGEAALAATAIGIAARAARGGVSGEEDVERRKELQIKSPELRAEEREQLGAASEKKIEEKLTRCGERERANVEALVARYEEALARLASEKAVGRVSESTLAELKALPEQIRLSVNISHSELDAIKTDVSRNIAVRGMRRKDVVDVNERRYDVEPSLAHRVGNVLLGTASTRKHVTEVVETVALPDRLPTLDQIGQMHRLAHIEGEFSDIHESINPRVLHPEEDHKPGRESNPKSRRKAA